MHKTTSKGESIVCIVPGYSVPRNVTQLDSLRKYVEQVRTYINEKIIGVSCDLHIILSGGPTAFLPPYEDTEAGELRKALGDTINNKGARFYLEESAASTLENILGARDIIIASQIRPDQIIIFVENIRVARMQEIISLVLPNFKVQIIPVDLGHRADSNAKDGEKLATALLKWCLDDPANLKWYHELCLEKVVAARAMNEQGLQFSNVDWWQTKWAEIKEHLNTGGYNV